MRIHNRLFLFTLLVPAYFTVSGCADADAQGRDASAVKGGRWSDTSTWSGGAVPKAGDIVTIGAGLDVVLDVSPPALHGLNLNGKLSFADNRDLELTSETTFFYHLMALIIVAVFTFVGSYLLYKITDLLLSMRVREDQEYRGLDLSQHGENIDA